jgi:hypothetical protein
VDVLALLGEDVGL